MTSFSKLQPYFVDILNDVEDTLAFFRSGLNYTDEDEERALKQFAGNIMRSIHAINLEMTDEEFLCGDDERTEEAIALSFQQYRSKRSDRASSESREAYAAEMAEVTA